MNLTAFFYSLTRQIIVIYLGATIITSCQQGTGKNSSKATATGKIKKEYSLSSPIIDEVYSYNDTLLFRLSTINKITPDSVHVYLEGNPVCTEKTNTKEFKISGIFSKVGRQNIRLVVQYNDSLSQTLTTRITVLSDIEPENLTYKLIRKFPHDEGNYTQGLIYYKGWLYEGTGRQNQSRLIRLDAETGKAVFERKLDNSIFGEGITIFGNKLYQLTYKNKIGFIYNLDNFELIRDFDLQTMEGWGLTTDGKELIVSDGSSVLYFYNPEYLNQTGQLDVAHNRGLVVNLNELEYVNGAIWANVYGDSYIVKIDAKTGKVLARLELESIFPAGLPRDIDHVLNGIAYNPVSQTFYITGKYWPYLYEIKIISPS